MSSNTDTGGPGSKAKLREMKLSAAGGRQRKNGIELAALPQSGPQSAARAGWFLWSDF